jgi:hypothetical protein
MSTPTPTPTPSSTPKEVNFKTIAVDFQTLANLHKQLNSFGLGDIDQLSYWTQSRLKEENTTFNSPYYPLLYIVPSKVEHNPQYKLWEFNTTVSDIVETTLQNNEDTLSDTLQILNDVVSQFRLSVIERFGDYIDKYYVDDEVLYTPYMGEQDDNLNGWNGILKIKTMTSLDRCSAAFNTWTGTTIQHPDGINFKTFTDDFRMLSEYHKQIQSFGFGKLDEFTYWNEMRLKEDNNHYNSPYYPYLFVMPGEVTNKFGFMEYKFKLIVADIIQRDLANQVDVLSDTNQIMDDIVGQFRLSVTQSLGNFNELYYLDDTVICVPFLEKYDDLLGGWTADLTIQVMSPLDRCDAAFNSWLTPTPTVTPTITPTASATPTNTPTPTTTTTPTQTNTQTSSGTPTPTPTNTTTQTQTPSETPTNTPSETPTNTPTNTNTGTPTNTPTNTQTQTQTPTNTPASCIWNFTVANWNDNTNLWNSCFPIPTPTMTKTPTQTQTPTNTQTQTPTNTQTQTQTNTPTVSPTASPFGPGTTEARLYLAEVLTAGGTGITNTVSAATITLFTSLVSYGLYDNLTVFYPMLGGVATSTALNGNRNSGTTYDLQYSGTGFTYTSSGATGNGATSYANTNFRNTFLLQDNYSLGFYQFSDNIPLKTEEVIMGNLSVDIPVLQIATNLNPSLYFIRSGANGGATTAANGGNVKGFYALTRTGSTSSSLFRNGNTTPILTATNSYTKSGSGANIFLWNFNFNGNPYSNSYANQTLNFAFIGKGLTASQISTLSTIINLFQTTLGRNTY